MKTIYKSEILSTSECNAVLSLAYDDDSGQRMVRKTDEFLALIPEKKDTFLLNINGIGDSDLPQVVSAITNNCIDCAIETGDLNVLTRLSAVVLTCAEKLDLKLEELLKDEDPQTIQQLKDAVSLAMTFMRKEG